MPRKSLNYNSPFGFSITSAMPEHKSSPSKQAHARLELNRLNTYIRKAQEKLTIFPKSGLKLGAHYRNLKNRLQSLKERKAKLLERGAHFFVKT